MERGVLVGAAGLRWASWVWLTVVALANLHRVHHAPLAVTAVAVTGAATLVATLALRDGAWQQSLRPGWVGTELAVAIAVVAADGWVEQGRLTGQTLAGSWPVPTILVAALAGGMAWGIGSAALLAVARAVAVAVSGWTPGQAGRVWLAVTSTAIEWIAFGAASAVVIRLLRRAHRQLAEAEVRDRIARDLHDGVLQTLTLIERRSPSPEIAQLARDQERDLRAYLFGDYQDHSSLGAVLRSTAGRFEQSWPGTTATVAVSDDVADWHGSAVDAVGGAVTEALTNAAKHGRATRAGFRGRRGGVRRALREHQGRRLRLRPQRGQRGSGHGPEHQGTDRAPRRHGRVRVGRRRRSRSAHHDPDGRPQTELAVVMTVSSQPEEPVYTVVLADDHPTVRSGIKADLRPPFQVVGEAGDAIEALGLIDAHQPQLVVCDLNMPNGGGLRVVRETAARHGEKVKVIVFTVSEHERDLLDAVASGAYGYLTKSTPGPELHRQLVRAAQGDPPFAPQLATLLLGEFRRVARTSSGANPISDREREVLGLVGRGYTYRQVGSELFISEKTVENHVRNILHKLHLTRRDELIRWAADHGIR